MASWVGSPTLPEPVEDMIEASDRTRSGCSIASVCATKPPSDAPTTWTASYPSAATSPETSPAMSESRYGGSSSSPRQALVTDGTPS